MEANKDKILQKSSHVYNAISMSNIDDINTLFKVEELDDIIIKYFDTPIIDRLKDECSNKELKEISDAILFKLENDDKTKFDLFLQDIMIETQELLKCKCSYENITKYGDQYNINIYIEIDINDTSLYKNLGYIQEKMKEQQKQSYNNYNINYKYK